MQVHRRGSSLVEALVAVSLTGLLALIVAAAAGARGAHRRLERRLGADLAAQGFLEEAVVRLRHPDPTDDVGQSVGKARPLGGLTWVRRHLDPDAKSSSPLMQVTVERFGPGPHSSPTAVTVRGDDIVLEELVEPGVTAAGGNP